LEDAGLKVGYKTLATVQQAGASDVQMIKKLRCIGLGIARAIRTYLTLPLLPVNIWFLRLLGLTLRVPSSLVGFLAGTLPVVTCRPRRSSCGLGVPYESNIVFLVVFGALMALEVYTPRIRDYDVVHGLLCAWVILMGYLCSYLRSSVVPYLLLNNPVRGLSCMPS
jgi:hypothetical protein